MEQVPTQTASLCPHCLQRIPARRVIEDGAVYLEKQCPVHGDLEKVLLWRDTPTPYGEWMRCTPDVSELPEDCPDACGLCAQHKQKTCTAVIEVTSRCDLRCPVCFSTSGTGAGAEPDLAQMRKTLQMVLDQAGPCPLQLSGGEPTLRDDLPSIVALAQSMGFDPIQVNTNGCRMARDAEYVEALRNAGCTTVYLQFDGTADSVYRRIRGADLLTVKLKALEVCARLKMGVILVPTIVRNVNDSQIGNIIQLAKEWMPVIKGVHFQPMTYLGRYPESPRNEDRFLLMDVLTAIEEQTGGELRVDNFLPSG